MPLNAFLNSLSQFTQPQKKQERFVVAVAIGSHSVEGAVYCRESGAILRSSIVKLSPGIINAAGDTIADGEALGNLILGLLRDIQAPSRNVHLCVPCTLIRVVELPKMEADEYYVSLASEAERFRAFDNTEAIVAYELLPGASSPVNQRLVYTAMRKDTFLQYHKTFKAAQLRLASLNVEPIQVVRGMMATGMMEMITNQAGTEDFCWGTMLHEFDRLRFMVWQGRRLVEIREITMSGQLLSHSDENAVVLGDLVMELKRTIASVKPLEPQFWFSNRISYVLLQHLQRELGVTFKSFQLPAGFKVDRADICMSVVGSCFSELGQGPYRLNLLETQSPYQLERDGFQVPFFSFGSARGFDEAEGESAGPRRNLPSVMVFSSLGLVIGVWVILSLVNLYFSSTQEQTTLSGKQLKASIERSSNRLEYYKQHYLLASKILTVAQSSKEVNGILLGLLSDIQHLPSSLWFTEVAYDEQVSLTGYALQHNDIIDVTQHFEQRDYGRNFVLHHINEETLDATGTHIYTFLIGGQLSLRDVGASSSNIINPLSEATQTGLTTPVTEPNTLEPLEGLTP